MAHAVRHGNPVASLYRSERTHPLQNVFVTAAIVLGGIAVLTSIFHGLHMISAWTGLVGVLAGAWGQFISATTSERFVLITGLAASGVGFYLGMMHGGLLP